MREPLHPYEQTTILVVAAQDEEKHFLQLQVSAHGEAHQRARVGRGQQFLREDTREKRLCLIQHRRADHQKHEPSLSCTLEEVAATAVLDQVTHGVGQLNHAHLPNPQPVLLTILTAGGREGFPVHFCLCCRVGVLLNERNAENPLENADAHVLHGAVVGVRVFEVVVLGDGVQKLEQPPEEVVRAEVSAVEHGMRQVVSVDGLLLQVRGEHVTVHQDVVGAVQILPLAHEGVHHLPQVVAQHRVQIVVAVARQYPREEGCHALQEARAAEEKPLLPQLRLDDALPQVDGRGEGEVR